MKNDEKCQQHWTKTNWLIFISINFIIEYLQYIGLNCSMKSFRLMTFYHKFIYNISLYRSIFQCWWAVPFCHGEYTINMNVWTRFISRTISTHSIDRMKINIVLLAYLLLLLSNSIFIIIPSHQTYSYAWNALASAITSFFIGYQLNRINEKIINILFLFNIDDIALARQVNM